MSNQLIFTAEGVAGEFTISSPNGVGGTNWHVYHNRYFLGSINRMTDGWRLFLNDKAKEQLSPSVKNEIKQRFKAFIIVREE